MNENKIKTVDDEIAYNNYKLTADKILQLLSQIREDPSASSKRWVWELLQNAKDVPNRFGKVSVEIELVSQDTLKFRHNGDCFTTKNITGLVQQVSSKDSQNLEGQTGKFGTGFICTHLLSDIIDVEGIVKYMGVNRRFKIVLDRSGYRSEDLLPRIESTLEELRHIETTYEVVDNYEENRTEESFDTVFTYHLTTQEKQESAIAGLEDLVNTLPVTLVTQSNKIKQVRVIDRLKGTNVVYTCESKSLGDNVFISEVKIDDVIKKYLSYITEEVALTTEICYDNNIYEIVKRDSKHPVLYRDFPLIGSEKFYFPYILNGFNFNPTERRNGLLLNSADHPNCISNRNIVDKAVAAVLKFNDWLITHNATNRYLLASSRIPKSSEEYSENVAAPWIKNLQIEWRKQLLQEELVETDEGTDLLVNISIPAFTSTATKETNETFYNLLQGHYIGRGVLPAFKYLHGWLDVVRPEYETWGTQLKYDKDDFLKDLSAFKSVSTLSSKISKTREEIFVWLNKVYKFLVEQNMLNEFDNYAIIPNQRGDFKLLKELYSDHSSRIPSIVKDIYNSVNQDNATAQHMLMAIDVEASVFGNTLRHFSMQEMIAKLNEYIKSTYTIIKNGKSIFVASEVAYSILALYPNISDDIILKNRKAIYDFCSDYKVMNTYSMVETIEMDLWKEADNYWFKTSYWGISSKGTVANMASSFFRSNKTQDETLLWLNRYIQFYQNNSHGDLIKEQSIFPNQLLELKKLSELRYDNDIPEEFKDLAKNAYNSIDTYRPKLLHRAIKGYEQQNPLSIKDIYEFVKKRFEDSNDSTKEVIARHVITILVKQESGEPEERKLYDFATTISNYKFDDAKYVELYSGFNWGFAQEFYIKFLAKRIAESINLDGFKLLSPYFVDKDYKQLTEWIDSFIEFLHNYKSKKFWSIITDKDKSFGIWLNQNNAFCKFNDVRKDENISEELKDICANNIHLKHDFRNEMFSLDSSNSSYLETTPFTLQEIGEYIDEKIKSYDGNKQDNDFRTLVFAIGKLCNLDKRLEGFMTYFKETKNSLIVWSLGEGETLDFVGSIVQQGDDKIREIKEILDDTSLEDLKEIKTFIKKSFASNGGKLTKEIFEGFNNQASIENVKLKEEIEELKRENEKLKGAIVSYEEPSLEGMSDEEKKYYSEQAKEKVLNYLKGLGYNVENAESEFSCVSGVTKNNEEYPLVVRSYTNKNRGFSLSAPDWLQLSRENAMLWIVDSDGKPKSIPFDKLMSKQGNITLRFNTQNFDNEDISSQHKLVALATVLRWFKGLQFDFSSLSNDLSTSEKLFSNEKGLTDDELLSLMKGDSDDSIK